jgi:hypothetical protein
VYTPAVIVGSLSGLVSLYAGLNLIESNSLRSSRVVLALSSVVGILDKPEYLAATLTLIVLIAAFRRPPSWWKGVLGLAALLVENLVPAVLVYAWLASRVTWPRLRQGLTAYDAAASLCGWWPTGYGIVLQLAALGRGLIMVGALGVVAVFFSSKVIPKTRVVVLLVAGILLAALQRWQDGGALHDPSGRPLFFRFGYYLLRPNTVLLPVVAASFIAAPLLLWCLWQGRNEDTREMSDVALFTILALCMAYTCRGWFSETTQNGPTLSVASYPYCFLLLPLLLKKITAWLFPVDIHFVDRLLGLLFALYPLSCLLGTFLISRHHFDVPILETRAGPVRPGVTEPVAEIYTYVASHLVPGESFLELGYGGGMTMAAALHHPLYSVEMRTLKPPEALRLADANRFVRQPPKLVVVDHMSPHFGTELGGIVGCSFPHFRWKPPHGDLDRDYVYPIIPILQDQYREVFRAGTFVVLERRR